MVEVHIIGRLESAAYFPEQRLFCRWELETGGGWRVVEGETEGQTQTDLGEHGNTAYFSHPLDIHLASKCLQGWPSISVQVWHYDEFGRQQLYGYGTTFLPASPGDHKTTFEVLCRTWRPKGTYREEMMQHFIGGGLQIERKKSMSHLNEKSNLRIVTMGHVNVQVSIIIRHFDRFGIQC